VDAARDDGDPGSDARSHAGALRIDARSDDGRAPGIGRACRLREGLCIREARRIGETARVRVGEAGRVGSTAQACSVGLRGRSQAARFRGAAEARDLRGAGSIAEEMIRALVLSALMLGCRSKTGEPSNNSTTKAAGEMLKVGDVAPSTGKLDLAPYKGKSVVVYFYPKDDTPGCTKEACAFRDAWERFSKANVQVVGVSVDDEESHKKFVEKYKLPFPLVADTDKSICAAYGVPINMGHASRVSFLIGPDGKIKKVYPKVDPAVHADEILQDSA
jgi:peroxiredoxin